MSDEKLSALFRASVAMLVFVGVLYTGLRQALSPKATPSLYFVAKDAVDAEIYGDIEKFAPPSQLSFERIDDRSTNISGWFSVHQKAEGVVTQWFTCKVTRDGRNAPTVSELKIRRLEASNIYKSGRIDPD